MAGIDAALTCGLAEPLLAARAAGAITLDSERQLDAHLERCEPCARVARELDGPLLVDALHGARALERNFDELTEVSSSNYVRGSEIGRGGMGTIVRARDRRLGRVVAIKQLLDDRVRARFEHEARLTARLQHPAIVTIYEAGRWPSGEPFYAMKYVAGRPLDQVVADLATLGERLTLLANLIIVVEAIAYAHSEGVVHRDLKPHNILIGPFGESVVIDWGLAKDLRADGGPGAPFRGEPGWGTQDGAGTPAYMAPEQARGDAPDQRVDVYALGATLHHVLAGAPPEARPLPADTPPDLRAIVAKATAPDPDGRYPTAAELARELTRFRDDQLVAAHRYTAGQLVRRWLRRHRGVVIVAAIALVVLAIGAAFSVRRIVAERDRANREAATTRRISDFVVGIFAVPDPSETHGRSVTARELLDTAAAKIDARLTDDPTLQARLLATMGRTYALLGLDTRALALLDRADETERQTLGPDHPETLTTRCLRAVVHRNLGRQAEAEAELQAVLAASRRVLGRAHPDTFEAQFQLAATIDRRGRPAEAEALLRELIPVERWILGPEHEATLASLNDLGALLDEQGHHAEAEVVLRDVLATERRVLGPEHRSTLYTLGNVGNTLQRSRRYREAEQVYRAYVELSRRVLGVEHPDTQRAMVQLANALDELQRSAEAEQLYREVLAIQRRVLPAVHPQLAYTLYNLAALEVRQGRTVEGLADLQAAIAGGMEAQLAHTLASDEDFAALRGVPAFEALVEQARVRTGAPPGP